MTLLTRELKEKQDVMESLCSQINAIKDESATHVSSVSFLKMEHF